MSNTAHRISLTVSKDYVNKQRAAEAHLGHFRVSFFDADLNASLLGLPVQTSEVVLASRSPLLPWVVWPSLKPALPAWMLLLCMLMPYRRREVSISAWLTNLTALTDLDGQTASEPAHSGTVRGGGGYRAISCKQGQNWDSKPWLGCVCTNSHNY